jgi:hypothetical protein
MKNTEGPIFINPKHPNNPTYPNSKEKLRSKKRTK